MNWESPLWRLFTLAILVLPRAGCIGRVPPQTATAQAEDRPCTILQKDGPCVYHTSLVDLIANPARWNGKRVIVDGFMHLEFEGNAIYVSEQDCRHFITKNGVWVDFREGSYGEAQALNDHYVRVQGTFDSKQRGHLGLWSGTLDDIDRTLQLPP
jgi:hypothetical protein